MGILKLEFAFYFITLGFNIYISSLPFESNNQICLAAKAQKNPYPNVRGFVCPKDTSWGGWSAGMWLDWQYPGRGSMERQLKCKTQVESYRS